LLEARVEPTHEGPLQTTPEWLAWLVLVLRGLATVTRTPCGDSGQV